VLVDVVDTSLHEDTVCGFSFVLDEARISLLVTTVGMLLADVDAADLTVA
jgi:hypothetical protein